MGYIRDLINKFKEKGDRQKAYEEEIRIQERALEKKKSANERELERYQKEEREEQIKGALEYYRKRREHEINFNHNPLDTPNITNHTEWEILKERNIFSRR